MLANVTRGIIFFTGSILFIYILYFLIITLFSILPQKKKDKYGAKNRFAAIIAARNEEEVIGNLIESLKNQNYPKELFDIIVVINNCTDDTKKVSITKGADIFECSGKIRSKGDALKQFFDDILSKPDKYDAFCIFDADNLVSPDFLLEMNSSLCRGDKVAQGYRESKNPYDSSISSCYAIYYYMINRFYNHARSNINSSAMINGTGFMVSSEIIKHQGGWHTFTMTEDIEFTTKCILAGEKIAWVPEAIVYDEQPQEFSQSWVQRKRWSTGVIQGIERYFWPLAKNTFKNKSLESLDLIMFYISPIIQMFAAGSISLLILLNLLQPNNEYFVEIRMLFWVLMLIIGSYIFSVFTSTLAVKLEKKSIIKMMSGIMSFWFFIMSWIPINITCFVKKQTEWTPIKHTRAVELKELLLQKH